MIEGGLVFAVGLAVTIGTMASGDGGFVLAYGALIAGPVLFIVGMAEMSKDEEGEEGGGPTVAHPARLVSGEIHADDYPEAALDADQQGSATVGFTVSTDGRVADVQLVTSSGSAVLDEATCRIVAERFSYAPAKDRNMNPVPARKEQTITWRLPD